MTATALRLELNGQSLDLDDWDNNGFIIAEIDLGLPAVRVVSDSLPGQDGTFDQSSYFDARTVMLTGSIVPTLSGASRSKALDLLAPYLRPGAGATLVYAIDDDMAERCLDFAYPTQFSNPINHPLNATGFTMQLVCPNPIAYAQAVSEIDVPFASGSSDGFTFPMSFPLTFPTGGGTGAEVFVTSEGTYVAWPILRIFGPCTDPAVYWIDPITDGPLGVQVVFSGIAVDDGDYLEIDTHAKTALLNGDPNASRYNFVDFVNTTWGPLQPGTNILRFSTASASLPSVAAVRWQDTFLS